MPWGPSPCSSPPGSLPGLLQPLQGLCLPLGAPALGVWVLGGTRRGQSPTHDPFSTQIPWGGAGGVPARPRAGLGVEARLLSYFLKMRWAPVGACLGGKAPHAAAVGWRGAGKPEPPSNLLGSQPLLEPPPFASPGGFLPPGMAQTGVSLSSPSPTHGTGCPKPLMRTLLWAGGVCPSSVRKSRGLLGVVVGGCPGKGKALLEMGDLVGRWRITKKHKGRNRGPSCHGGNVDPQSPGCP